MREEGSDNPVRLTLVQIQIQTQRHIEVEKHSCGTMKLSYLLSHSEKECGKWEPVKSIEPIYMIDCAFDLLLYTVLCTMNSTL